MELKFPTEKYIIRKQESNPCRDWDFNKQQL